MIYLASPYSHGDVAIRKLRFEQACFVAGRLMQQGHLIFSPIAHTHPIATRCNLPLGFDYWQRYDQEMLDACASLVVLTLPGWELSLGVTSELQHMRARRKPVGFVRWPFTTEGVIEWQPEPSSD